jgi:hypothetical protein
LTKLAYRYLLVAAKRRIDLREVKAFVATLGAISQNLQPVAQVKG